jgi:hypothetical protein
VGSCYRDAAAKYQALRVWCLEPFLAVLQRGYNLSAVLFSETTAKYHPVKDQLNHLGKLMKVAVNLILMRVKIRYYSVD